MSAHLPNCTKITLDRLVKFVSPLDGYLLVGDFFLVGAQDLFQDIRDGHRNWFLFTN